MKEYIDRPYYIKKIEPFIGKSLIKVITGQRRVGKSYLLMQIRDIIQKRDPDTQIIFINKEQHFNDHRFRHVIRLSKKKCHR